MTRQFLIHACRGGAGLAVVLLNACGGGAGSEAGGSTPTAETPLVWTAPGGSATVPVDAEAPFMQYSAQIDASEMVGVSQGRELFLAEWQAAPGPRALLDGLGPLFNANSCATCHAVDGRVAPLSDDGSTTPAILFRLGNASGDVHPTYGGQLQSSATSGLAEGLVTWSRNAVSGTVDFLATLFGTATLDGYALGPRISPHLVGMGLLDLVPESRLLEYADPDDQNGDGISGRAHWVTEEGLTRIGRFGWKAINASLRTQNAGAMHQDMGLTTPVNSLENCSAGQSVCDSEASGGSPEVSDASLTAVVDFMTVLAVPDRRITEQAAFDRGARLFNATGCVACHRPTLITGTSSRFPSLTGQTIYPYTDLLLHDMGPALSDGVKEKDAGPSEWRTPPLWGIGLVEQKVGARFLHDGRASTLREAIEWHGGEAQAARDRFLDLSENDQQSLLQFLRGI